MAVRGIRGATTVNADIKDEILTATRELLEAMQQANSINLEDIASVLFTVTPDIKSVFPAVAARSLGWNLVPLMCFQEIPVREALPLCIRVLIHINTDKTQEEIVHVYLNQARELRRDLVK
ncbi:MAG: chorismate mutase [Syntrophomonadaceae bacterium]